MTQRLREFLDIPPPPEPDPEAAIDEQGQQLRYRGQQLLAQLNDGTDHAIGLDTVYTEVLGHARDLMAYGYNVDGPRARGFFEIAASMYGHAVSAKNTKREEQLKTLRLALEARKIDLEEKRTNHTVGQMAATIDPDGATIVVEDRNQLLARLRQQLVDEAAGPLTPSARVPE